MGNILEVNVNDGIERRKITVTKANINTCCYKYSGEIMSALMIASTTGDYKSVKSLLENGAQVDLTNNSYNGGYSALMWASNEGHYKVAKLLLKNGAQVDLKNKDGWSALMLASKEGNSEVVKLLLENGAEVDLKDSDGWSALMWASELGHSGMVELLLENGAQVDLKANNGWSALIRASLHGYSKVVQLLLEKGAQVDLKDNRGWSALMWASRNGHSEVIKLLLENGAQVSLKNNDGNCALALTNKAEVVKLLLENGAQEEASDSDYKMEVVTHSSSSQGSTEENHKGSATVNITNCAEREEDEVTLGQGISTQDQDGMTLEKNSLTPDQDGVTLEKGNPTQEQDGVTLEKGNPTPKEEAAGTDLQDHSDQSLISASATGQYEVVKLLLEKGARVDLQDKDGQSALMYACSRGDYKMTQLLLEWGAGVDLQNNIGESALMIASKHDQCDTAKLLLDNGADVDLQSSQYDTAMSLALLREQTELISLLKRKIDEMSDSDGCRLGKSTGDSPTEATPTSVPAITVQHALADVVDTSSHEYTVANSVQANSDQPNETLAGVKDSESVRSTAGVITDSFDLKCPRVPLSLNTLCLIKWRDEDGRQHQFRLINRVSSKWRKFGLRFGLEVNQLDAWEEQYLLNAETCWHKVVGYWLNSGAHYTVSWEGLCELLEDMNLAQIAHELKVAVHFAIPPKTVTAQDSKADFPSLPEATPTEDEPSLLPGDESSLHSKAPPTKPQPPPLPSLPPTDFYKTTQPISSIRTQYVYKLCRDKFGDSPLPNPLFCPTPSRLLVMKVLQEKQDD